MKFPPLYVIAGGAAVAAYFYIKAKGGATNAGQAIGTGAVDMANGVLGGVVTGVGEVVGIPPTNLTECQRAQAEGRTWDASFACPAKDFLSYLFK